MTDATGYLEQAVSVVTPGGGEIELFPADPARVLCAISNDLNSGSSIVVRLYVAGKVPYRVTIPTAGDHIFEWSKYGIGVRARVTVDGLGLVCTVYGYSLTYQ